MSKKQTKGGDNDAASGGSTVIDCVDALLATPKGTRLVDRQLRRQFTEATSSCSGIPVYNDYPERNEYSFNQNYSTNHQK